ncbi:MAG: ECF-type sigma factor, partial [Gemmatimonadota bacterium]
AARLVPSSPRAIIRNTLTLYPLAHSLPESGHTPQDPALVDQLVPVLYADLRRLARLQLRHEPVGHTLTTTALVHEAYLRLAGPGQPGSADRSRFLAAASVAMRRVLIDYARRHRADKRGGQWVRVELTDLAATGDRADTLLALDDALADLRQLNPRMADVVDCRFFGGMTDDETAQALGVTARTVRRDWVKARALIADALEAPAP